VAGKVAYAEAGPYCASKHAVHAITEAARQELRGSAIHACLVVPGTVDTPLFEHAANFSGREILAMRPICDAERVASAIVRCASKPRREVVVGAAPRALALLDHVLPGVYERVMRALVVRDHLGRAGVGPDEGNLRAPRGPHATGGDWRERRRPSAKLIAE